MIEVFHKSGMFSVNHKEIMSVHMQDTDLSDGLYSDVLYLVSIVTKSGVEYLMYKVDDKKEANEHYNLICLAKEKLETRLSIICMDHELGIVEYD